MKQSILFLLSAALIAALSACGPKSEATVQPTETEAPTDFSEEDILPEYTVNLKNSTRLVIGAESFDVKTVIDLQNGRKEDDFAFEVVGGEDVADVDENGIITRKAYGQSSIQISIKDKPAVFNIFNITFAPQDLYGTAYKGGFKKADGTLGNEISLQLEEDIIGAFGKSQSGTFVVRIKLRTVNVEGDVKSVVVELSAE